MIPMDQINKNYRQNYFSVGLKQNCLGPGLWKSNIWCQIVWSNGQTHVAGTFLFEEKKKKDLLQEHFRTSLHIKTDEKKIQQNFVCAQKILLSDFWRNMRKKPKVIESKKVLVLFLIAFMTISD